MVLIETNRARIGARLRTEGWTERHGGNHGVFTHEGRPRTHSGAPPSHSLPGRCSRDRETSWMGQGKRMTRYIGLIDGTPPVVGVVIPDLPGCTSGGKTYDEACRNSIEACAALGRRCFGEE